ncbi:MAG: alanine racemase, partial [Anaerolineae bacterium]
RWTCSPRLTTSRPSQPCKTLCAVAMITLDDLLAATAGHTHGPVRATSFRDFAFDSRLIQPGELFLAVKTERGDGHDYIREACEKGAAGVLAQHPVDLAGHDVTCILVDDTQAALQRWGRYILQKYDAEVIGVTGSTGKTTTKEAIAHVLAGHFQVFKNPGNWNGRYGLAIALGRLRSEHQLAVLEMASDSHGEIADLAGMAPPKVAVVTTVQPAHLDVFGDLETIAREKADLVRALPPAGTALLNADDPRVRAMAGQTAANVITFGLAPDADLTATNVTVTPEGTQFTLHISRNTQYPIPNTQFTSRDVQHITVSLLGRHAIYPALAAISVGLLYGIDLDAIIQRLETLERVPGRLNPLPGRNGSLILDDTYNASPQATIAALDVLAALPAHRRVAVLGDMPELGHQTEAGHRQVGRHAAGIVDQLVSKGGHARLIAEEAERAGLDSDRVVVTYTTEDAVRAAGQNLGPGDVVLVKGGLEARMESVVGQLLADPAQAARHLVRQDAAWQQILILRPDRPTWVEIDLGAIAHNTRRIKEIVGPDVDVMVTLKADAYGHGAVKVAQTALNNGATWLGVACLPEAQVLRDAGIAAPILILGYTPAWQARDALRYDLRATVFSVDVARALSKAAVALNREARVHIKVDTGMHRLGLFPEEVIGFIQAIRDLPNLVVEGLFTHFSVADDADDWYRVYTGQQLQKFQRLLTELEEAGIRIPVIHAANSAGTLTWPEARFNLVRPGIAVYGLAPSPDVPLPPDFRPALTWKTQIAQVKDLPPGSYVSYGATYRTDDRRRIAVIPVGYADGFRRAPRTWEEVLVRGRRAPIVGRVCMDQTMIDVTHIAGVRQGDEVVLIGEQGDDRITAEEVAERLGTINYEVVSEILARVPRVS